MQSLNKLFAKRGLMCAYIHPLFTLIYFYMALGFKENNTEPEFVNVQGTRESIPRIRLCQPM
jgi:hypothetical protein